ncbi:hypothetical protein H0A71_05870 [Alcaligenaceae bacterium]|nr:hypothetical protein [Alcaligenaceae bacterium]
MSIQSLNLVIDLNGDGSYSLLEISEFLRTLYRLPGNVMVEGLGHIPYLSSFLGIEASKATGYGSFDGLLSISLSLIFWVAVVYAALTLSSPDVEQPENHPATLAQGQGTKLPQDAKTFTAYKTPSDTGHSFYGVPLPTPANTRQALKSHSRTPAGRASLKTRKVAASKQHFRHLTGYLARHAK